MMSRKELEFIRQEKRKKYIIIISQISIVLLFLFIWELLSDFKIINPFVFSSPIKVVRCLSDLIVKGELWQHLLTTVGEILLSFCLGFGISFILALLLLEFDMLYKIMDPFLNILNSLPKVALGPILIIWFGANGKAIIVMALLINMVVCLSSLYVGFVKCDKYYTLLFDSFNASKWQRIKWLVIPSARENIISSLKLNISMTLIGVIMGEFLVSKKGIGYLIIYGTQVFNLDLVYAGILLLLVLSFIIYKPINLLEMKIKKEN